MRKPWAGVVGGVAGKNIVNATRGPEPERNISRRLKKLFREKTKFERATTTITIILVRSFIVILSHDVFRHGAPVIISVGKYGGH